MRTPEIVNEIVYLTAGASLTGCIFGVAFYLEAYLAHSEELENGE